VGAEHRWEKWADFPDARQRLFDVIRQSNAPGVVLISGDRHRGELSRHDDAVGYPLYELTSSGMTHYSPSPGERNQHRVGDLVQALHFGLLTFDFDAPDPTIGFQLRGLRDTLLLDHSVPLSALQPAGYNRR
jgi:alkaline phosphatase D